MLLLSCYIKIRKEDTMENTNVFDLMKEDINNANIPDSEKQKLLSNLFKMQEKKMNIMITGATGCGKSSTINALFNTIN